MILQMRKSRLREKEKVTEHHIASQWGRQGLNLGILAPSVFSFLNYTILSKAPRKNYRYWLSLITLFLGSLEPLQSNIVPINALLLLLLSHFSRVRLCATA